MSDMSEPCTFLSARTLYQTAVVRVQLMKSVPGQPLQVEMTYAVTVDFRERADGIIVDAGFRDDKLRHYVDVPKNWHPTESACAEVARQFVNDWMASEKEE